MSYSILFVCLLGLGTVFAGLLCIILLCKIMSGVCNVLFKEKSVPSKTSQQIETVQQNTKIENRQEVIAAISAVIADDMGKDVSAIKILSLKRI